MAYSLIHGLYEWFTHRDPVLLLLIGLDNAGKTSVLELLKSACTGEDAAGRLSSVQPTVGLNIGSLEVAGAPVTIWDLGGARGLRGIWSEYYDEAHAVVFVVDAGCPSRFQEAKHALDAAFGTRALVDAPLLLLAHNEGTGMAGSAVDVAREMGVHPGGEGRPCHVVGTKVTAPLDVLAAFEWVVRAAQKSSRARVLLQRA